MVTITITIKKAEEGKGERLPGTSQGKKERRIAPKETMSADYDDTVGRVARSDSDGPIRMEESYPARWAVTALVPFAKGRDSFTVGGELQESCCYVHKDVATLKGEYHDWDWLVAGLVCR